MTRKLGGGIGSAVNKNVGVRTGAPRHAVNERGVSQIGQQLGNKATDKARTLSGAAESVITSKVGLRVCPDTLGRITKFSKHEPN